MRIGSKVWCNYWANWWASRASRARSEADFIYYLLEAEFWKSQLPWDKPDKRGW